MAHLEAICGTRRKERVLNGVGEVDVELRLCAEVEAFLLALVSVVEIPISAVGACSAVGFVAVDELELKRCFEQVGAVAEEVAAAGRNFGFCSRFCQLSSDQCIEYAELCFGKSLGKGGKEVVYNVFEHTECSIFDLKMQGLWHFGLMRGSAGKISC